MFNLFKKSQKDNNLEEVVDFINAHLKQLEDKKSSIPNDVFDVSKFFLQETADLYTSMNILIKKNHFYGCIPIARSIFENSVNLQYIYKQDTEIRAKNFKQKSASLFLKRHEDLMDNSEQFTKTKLMFEEMLKNYVPDNKNLKEKAEEVNKTSMYKDAYKRLSEYVHPVYKENRNFEEDRPYTIFMKRLVFSDTVIITIESLQKICEMYNLNGGVMVIEEPSYKGTIFFATNPGKQQFKN